MIFLVRGHRFRTVFAWRRKSVTYDAFTSRGRREQNVTVPDLADVDDRLLVPLIAQDPAALEEFYRRHVRPLTRYVTRKLGDPHDAADVVAATFLAAMESGTGYDATRGKPAAWLWGIASNVIAMRWRRTAAESRAVARLGGRPPAAPDEYGRSDERLDARSEARPVIAAFPSLSATERELIELVVHEQLTVGEAAAALGIRPATARMRLARARARLAPRTA
jgi:RNA polymerase sigma-70 factor (ECF subfamily)